MLKDYFYTCSSNKVSNSIEEILSMQACFPTYGRYRGYCKRVQSSGKAFLWNGLYYEVSEQCRDKLLSLLKQCSK